MTHKKLIERLGYWADILNLVQKIRPNGLYKLTMSSDEDSHWFLVVPKRYKLIGMSLHLVASSRSYVGLKTPLVALSHTYAYFLKNYTVEEVDKKDLPLYISSPFVGPAMEKILKGKLRIRSRHARISDRQSES